MKFCVTLEQVEMNEGNNTTNEAFVTSTRILSSRVVKLETMSSAIHDTVRKAYANKSISKLQCAVYMELLNIPPGKVTTYGRMAKRVNCNSARAIGQALRKNPFAPDVPCHRVLKANFSLGGFSGSTDNSSVEKKMKILQKEGVHFQESAKNVQCSEVKVVEDDIWNFNET